MGTLRGIVDADPPDGPDAVPGGAAAVPASSGGSVAPREAEPPPLTLAEPPRPSFAEFYAGHFTELVRLAALLTGSRDAAPDLVQDCFVRLHGHWTGVRQPLPYVRRSVVHACASHHRRQARARRQPPTGPATSELEADEMEDAITALPTRQRAAVVLRYYADLPDADIARALRCRPGTVRSLIHRALIDLRRTIEP
jgi:RNA polymerase sigma-70 factor (sigma-E family)